MIYLVLGAGLFALFYWGARPRRLSRFARWRTAAGGAALLAFGAAAFVGFRGEWPGALVLAAIGVWFALSSRWPRTPARSSGMSDQDARAILGIGEGASVEDIRAAHTRLMRRAHPDVGGSTGLAAQINAARDRLLRK